jgi:hypothetical protein
MPEPASDLNPTVSQTVSRVIHEAMAKQPYHRFAAARDFADTLQKALRNEPIEIFNPRAHSAANPARHEGLRAV